MSSPLDPWVALVGVDEADRSWILGQLDDSERARLLRALQVEPSTTDRASELPQQSANAFADATPKQWARLLSGEPPWLIYTVMQALPEPTRTALPPLMGVAVRVALGAFEFTPPPMSTALRDLVLASVSAQLALHVDAKSLARLGSRSSLFELWLRRFREARA